MSNNKLKEVLTGAVAILEEIRDAFKNGTYGPRMWEVNDAISKAKSALAAPIRNCDVGTAKEQQERLRDSCKWLNAPLSQNRTCFGCPVHDEMGKIGKTLSCELVWAQMPYEEEK